MKKDYDGLISPQNDPHIRQKRILHLLSNGWLVLNLIVFAILVPEIRAWTVVLAVVFAVLTLIILSDERKSAWTWGSIIGEGVVSIAISVCYTLLIESRWYFAVIGAEVIISIVLLYIAKKND